MLRQILPPDILNETLEADHPATTNQQRRENRLLSRAPHSDALPLSIAHRKRAKYGEPHRSPSVVAHGSLC